MLRDPSSSWPGPAGRLLLTRWWGLDEAAVDRHEELASQTKPVPPKDWRHHGRCSASADTDSEMSAGYESCMQFSASFNSAFLFPSARTSLFLCKTKQRKLFVWNATAHKRINAQN